jgi:hypothetical protein
MTSVLPAMDDDYIKENAKERDRLFKLTAGLKDPDLARPVGTAWTVATKLLHLAFWDRYAVELLKQWKTTTPSTSTLDVDAVNESVKALSTAIPHSAIGKLVRDSAEMVDREVESATPELRSAVTAAGRERILKRFIHRRAHLDQIETALGRVCE